MKRLVICLDGTWNNAAREVVKGQTRVYRPTNVLKLARAIRHQADDQTLQITYYDAGVGAMNRAPDWRSRILRRVDRILGGGWGAGFEANIEQAYTFLANNYLPEDDILVFGFSRGAAQARSLTQLIQWVGGFPEKGDAYYVPQLFTGYLKARGTGDARQLVKSINRRSQADGKPRLRIVAARIRFLGVWDTVLSLGSRILSRKAANISGQAFHCWPDPPEIVDTIRHALALDETRHDFQAEVFEDRAMVEQRWFAGSHGNVGGGSADDALANLALRWMCREAERVGLALNSSFLKYYRSNPVGRLHAVPPLYRMADTMLYAVRGYSGMRQPVHPRDTLDPSVLKRIAADTSRHDGLEAGYRPSNLKPYLNSLREHLGNSNEERDQSTDPSLWQRDESSLERWAAWLKDAEFESW